MEGVRCGCVTRMLIEENLALMSASYDLKSNAFSNFALKYYPEIAPEISGIIPRQKMNEILEYTIKYAEHFSASSPSLFLFGKTGLGKTHISLALAQTVAKKGFYTVAGSVALLMKSIEAETFSRENDMESLRNLLECDLLILDDLGSEFDTSFNQSTLYAIIDGRLSSGRPTVISTNLSMQDLLKRYGDRIVSRITALCEPLGFAGNDIRQIKFKEKIQKK